MIAQQELKRSLKDIGAESTNLIEQMSDAERRDYLCGSLFLDTMR
jgi:hypothetical protein